MSTNGYVTIRLSDDERKKIDALAKRNVRSTSAEIRLAIREHLLNQGGTQ